MNYYVFKTNVDSTGKVGSVKSLFSKRPNISEWSFDLHDVDCVLRVRAIPELEEREIVTLLNLKGFRCEAL